MLAGLLLSGCVSKSTVQSMIDANHDAVVGPELAAQHDQIESLERQIQASRKMVHKQRDVMINHFRILKELSENALQELEGDDPL